MCRFLRLRARSRGYSPDPLTPEEEGFGSSSRALRRLLRHSLLLWLWRPHARFTEILEAIRTAVLPIQWIRSGELYAKVVSQLGPVRTGGSVYRI